MSGWAGHDWAALLFLLGVALWPILMAVRYSRRSGFSLIQVMVLLSVWLLAFCLWRVRIRRRSRVKFEGGAVLICNHRSSVDPFFVQSAMDRPVFWMVAREYCEKPLLGLLLKPVPIIPTSRSGVDSKAIRLAIEKAKQGHLVGILPEGRINKSEEFMLSVRPGAVLVALKAGVPIIPFYLKGSPFRESVLSPFVMSADVSMEVGEAYLPSQLMGDGEVAVSAGKEQKAMLVLDAVKRIAELAGEEGFVPRLAGRKWLDER